MNVGSISNTSASTYKASDSTLEALKSSEEESSYEKTQGTVIDAFA